ncbi:MAG TPA: KEOPS complex kinase/ATPase Bud32 [Candidatus Nanoarchaeia archaeon]|nr:Kae1-associated serine/threonine protein kinase [Candidatus Woesearchaeota archaeon]HIG92876.1 Kae1-associated serine/threonine protein kinase [Candidatus Woesearchaeota archaeon]HIH12568.1 Kae1-associated serine/threonine protein kinase [Candidatus Woesearchaeota archaeon]HLC70713.1 KEOPS complex kinase/ATPase Bud32 [Candidatus Nanoarchaeia archaeon]
MNQIAQGAEAILFRDRGTIIKERLSKAYRLPQLDESLRKFRTRREAKVLERLEEMQFPAPRLQDFSDQRMSIVMDFVPGEKLRDVLERGDEFQNLAFEMGEKIGKLHAHHLVHGDLTTSNMMVETNTGFLKFIDFGLSSFSEKIEDKAVDLFLLDRALESKHYQLYPKIFEKVLEGYEKAYPDAVKVLGRFEQVRGRGRNKKK